MSDRQLKLNIALKLVNKISKPAKDVALISGMLTKRLDQTRDALKRVDQQGREINYLERMDDKMRQNSASIADANERLDRYRRRLEAAQKAGRSHNRVSADIESATRKLAKLTAKQAEYQSQIKGVKEALNDAGIETDDYASAQRELDRRIESTTSKLNRQKVVVEAVTTGYQRLASRLGKVAKIGAIGIGSSLAGGAIGGSMLAGAARSEDYLATLKILEGSEDKARESFKWIETFAVKTPFQLDGVNEAFVKLRSYGLDPTNGLLRTLGDTASAMDKDIIDAVEAIADAVTGENERLKEFGITSSIDGDLITYTYTDKSGVQKKLQALKDERKNIEDTIRKIWDEKFEGAADERSKTWNGMVSNLGDHWSKFQGMIMDSGPFQIMKGRLSELLAMLDKMAASGELQEYAELIGEKLIGALDTGTQIFQGFWNVAEPVLDMIASVAEAVGGWENFAMILTVIAALKFSGVIGLLGVLSNLGWIAVVATQLKAFAGAMARIGRLLLLVGSAIASKLMPILLRFAPIIGRLIMMALGPIGLLATAAYLIINNFDSIVGYLSSLPSRFIQLGADMIEGIKHGISSKIQSVKDSILSIGEYLPGWLKTKLDIHSPSRVFAEIGQWIPEGLRVGIEQRKTKVVETITQLSHTLPKALPKMALALGLTSSPAFADTGIHGQLTTQHRAQLERVERQVVPVPGSVQSETLRSMTDRSSQSAIQLQRHHAQEIHGQLTTQHRAQLERVERQVVPVPALDHFPDVGKMVAAPAKPPQHITVHEHYHIEIHANSSEAADIEAAVRSALEQRDRQRESRHRTRLYDEV